MTDDVFDDIANLRIDPATAATARGAKGKAKPAKAKWQRHFIEFRARGRIGSNCPPASARIGSRCA